MLDGALLVAQGIFLFQPHTHRSRLRVSLRCTGERSKADLGPGRPVAVFPVLSAPNTPSSDITSISCCSCLVTSEVCLWGGVSPLWGLFSEVSILGITGFCFHWLSFLELTHQPHGLSSVSNIQRSGRGLEEDSLAPDMGMGSGRCLLPAAC